MCPRCHGRSSECNLCGGGGRKLWRRCPASQATPEAREALELHRHYEQGILPVTGGIDAQPAAYFDQLRIIESELALVRGDAAGGGGG